MGVDSTVSFPYGVEVSDVADVVAILLGKPKTWTVYHGSNDCQEGLTKPAKTGWTEVAGVKIEKTHSPIMVEFNIGEIPSPYGDGWMLLYYFEGKKGPIMSGGSRAERIALHRALAKFFGGRVDYQDCDSKPTDYRCSPPAWLGSESDRKYHSKQLAKWRLQPITAEEIQKCRKWAAYQGD